MMCKGNELAYRYWLHNVSGMGGKKGRYLLEKIGSAREIYFTPQNQLEFLVGEKSAANIARSKKVWDILPEYEKLKQQKIQMTTYDMQDYPQKLRFLEDAPAVLYYKGELPLQEAPSVAIIGARMCSEYGRRIAAWFGSKLGEQGIQIISGMAMGIDGISQEAALETGGKSFGVLGCSVDICYPKSNRILYEKLIQQGGLLSEYPPGTQPMPQLFPPRNRIISGLSDVVLVVEAKEKSGTLITVDMALEQGKEVYVVPGRITDGLSKGCLKLMKQGAGVALGPQDILELFQLPKRQGTQDRTMQGRTMQDRTTQGRTMQDRTTQGRTMQGRTTQDGITQDIEPAELTRRWNLSQREVIVYESLDWNPKIVDELHHDLKRILESRQEKAEVFSVCETMSILTGLCAKGLAQQVEAGLFQKNSPDFF